MALIEDLGCIAEIFFGIFSARDNLSLWVIGPSVGQFIAGIRQVSLMRVSGILENLIVQEFPRRKLCPRSWLRVEVKVNVKVIITIIIIIITIIIIIIISMDVNMLHTGTRAGPDFGRITTLLFQSPAIGSTKHDVNGLK